jgi:hypothetical protein
MTASSHIAALRLQPILNRFTNAPENDLRNGEKTINVQSPIAWAFIGFSKKDSLLHIDGKREVVLRNLDWWADPAQRPAYPS